MTTVYLVHGFNVKDGGEATVGWLKPVLEEAGYKAVMVRYGWLFRLRVRLCNSRLAKLWGSVAEPGSIAIGHSNGCDLIVRAAQEGAPFKKTILFNPALNSDTVFPVIFEEISVFYSPSDSATRLAKWIPWSRWGDMGTTGYDGEPDTRVVSFNEETLAGEEMGHSDFPKYPEIFGPLVVELCRN
jgi:hypothetical protein